MILSVLFFLRIVLSCSSVPKSCPTFESPWTAACQVSLSFTVFWSLLKLMSTKLVIPSFVAPFSSCHQSFPALGIFPMDQLYLHIRWPTYWSFSFSIILQMNIQGRFPLELTDLISLQTKELSGVFSRPTIQKHQFWAAQLPYSPTVSSIHGYWKNYSFDYMDFCWQSNISAF